MPNRILKESICTSETIDSLSLEAEAFFYRLMVQCDDFGRLDARPSVLRARCFPLRLDKVTDKLVGNWLTELAGVDLLWLYEIEGRAYLQVTTWDKHQQKRAKYSKYPQPPERDSNCNQVISDTSNSPREARSEKREYEKREGAGAPPARKPAKNEYPAVEVYRTAAGTYPNKTLWQSMDEAIGSKPDDLTFWQQVVTAWVAKGWNPRNLQGMFDFYKRRELPANGHVSKAIDPMAPSPTPEL